MRDRLPSQPFLGEVGCATFPSGLTEPRSAFSNKAVCCFGRGGGCLTFLSQGHKSVAGVLTRRQVGNNRMLLAHVVGAHCVTRLLAIALSAASLLLARSGSTSLRAAANISRAISEG